MNVGDIKKLLANMSDDTELVGVGPKSYYKIGKIESKKVELVSKVIGSTSRKYMAEYLDESCKEDPASQVVDVLVIT
jgi:hypothetical protein